MDENGFELVCERLRSGPPAGVFDLLISSFREQKKFPLLFEARLMKKRFELGLPVVHSGPVEELPKEVQADYEREVMEAAREVGSLFLAENDIPRAWPYFRAIGETAPVAAAIENVQPREGIEAIIEIAFYEQANPRKGFELLLATQGICRAITTFGHYPGRQGRDESLRLLVRTLHSELLENLKRTIRQAEGQVTETGSVVELISGRDWLFEGNSYYIDTSHVVSVLNYTPELRDRETLGLALELTEYGKHLGELFQFRGEPPFENPYIDYGVYLRALMGEDVERAIEHFRRKISDESDPRPAETLVQLLVRLGRFGEAVEISRRYLGDIEANQLNCPSLVQLCQMAGDYEQLMQIARERDDLLHFAAGAVQHAARGGH